MRALTSSRSARPCARTRTASGRAGASTITQQVAKNLFLWNGGGYVRKGMEAWLDGAHRAACGPKNASSRCTSNVAQFGRGVFGVGSRLARRFYRKPAARLTRAEAATLAAVLPNPIRLRADRPSAYVASRRAWIMGQMRGLGGREYLEEVVAPHSDTPLKRRTQSTAAALSAARRSRASDPV